MYKDIELKTKYHKEKIIEGFIKNGIYPDNKLIKLKLDNIETRLTIFKSPNFQEGEYVNAAVLNKVLTEIYNDLKILYELLYEITIKKFNNLNYFIESHIRELDEMTDLYIKKANLERLNTTIGAPIFFKHNEFTLDKIENGYSISLGELEINDTSNIICVTDTNNINHKDIIFSFYDGEKTYTCNSYSYNHDTLQFPGEVKTKEYEIKINEKQKINSMLELPIAATNYEGSRFVTLAGKDKILYKKANQNGDIIEESPIVINALSFDSHSYIDFYVIGGNSISFRFNKKPLATNFNMNDNTIKNLNYIHHFFIECDEGFSFDFELDKGSIYALRENTIINNNNFYYSGIIPINDFLIVHFLPGSKKRYIATMNIKDSNIAASDINGIMIKKLN